MANCANDFEPCSLVVQQMEIYYDVRTDIGATTTRGYIPMKHPFQSMKDQFNGNTEKRHLPMYLIGHEVYEMVKDVHVVLAKWKRTDKNTKEDNMWKKQSIFWELPYWKDLDVRHSIEVMHVEKNVCESILGTLLDTDRKTRDHGHA
jgi:hypothetical protein